MDFSPIQAEIARQLHHTKPEALTPGRDVGFDAPADEPTTLHVLVRARGIAATVRYEEGHDHYTVTVRYADGRETERHERVYCDTMTEIVWGDGAQDFEDALGPMVVVVMLDELDSSPPMIGDATLLQAAALAAIREQAAQSAMNN